MNIPKDAFALLDAPQYLQNQQHHTKFTITLYYWKNSYHKYVSLFLFYISIFQSEEVLPILQYHRCLIIKLNQSRLNDILSLKFFLQLRYFMLCLLFDLDVFYNFYQYVQNFNLLTTVLYKPLKIIPLFYSLLVLSNLL